MLSCRCVRKTPQESSCQAWRRETPVLKYARGLHLHPHLSPGGGKSRDCETICGKFTQNNPPNCENLAEHLWQPGLDVSGDIYSGCGLGWVTQTFKFIYFSAFYKLLNYLKYQVLPYLYVDIMSFVHTLHYLSCLLSPCLLVIFFLPNSLLSL